jgi:hypothetical protein
MARRPLVLLAVALSGWALGAWACNDVRVVNDSCSKASDCILPSVCCNEPSLPDGRPTPYCEELRRCKAYMPFLVEGNPCGRVPAVSKGGVEPPAECSEGLLCCAATLTCTRAEVCPAEPVPSGSAPPSQAPCSADPDCGAGEICCGISFQVRSGNCRPVQACP